MTAILDGNLNYNPVGRSPNLTTFPNPGAEFHYHHGALLPNASPQEEPSPPDQ